MAVYRDFDYDLRINGKLTVNGDLIIPSSNLTIGGIISGNSFRGDGSQLTNLPIPVATNIATNGSTNPISSDWAYDHANTYGLGSHVPTGGTSTNFLRGDGTWVIPTNTNYYVSSVTSTNGGRGTLTLNRSGLSALTIDLAHDHNDTYFTETEVNNLLAGKSNTSHLHDDRYYTESEVDTKLNGKMNYSDVIMNTNPFGGKKLYINSINNAMFRAESRFVTSGTIYNSDGTVSYTLSEDDLRGLFDGSYEGGLGIPANKYAIVKISFNGGNYPGYPYGNLYLSHYHTNFSESAKMRVYCNYEPHVIGWHEVNFNDYVREGSALIHVARQDKYAISEMEFEIHAPIATPSTVTQIDWQLDRPGSNEMPLVDKYTNNNLYNTLTFKDIGNNSNMVLRESGIADFKSINIASGGTVDGVDISDHVTLTGVGKHIPTGGTTSQYLRGDGSWATPADTNNFVSSLTSTDGGKGTLTLNRTGLTALTLNLGHDHNDVYYTETEINNFLAGKSDIGHTHSYDNYQNWKIQVNGGAVEDIGSTETLNLVGSGATTISRSVNTITISSTDTNTWRPLDVTPVNGNTANGVSSDWAFDHEAKTGVGGGHLPVAGTTSQYLRGDGTWATPPNTNNYLTGVTGTGNGTITFTRSGLTDLTLNLAHDHTEYVQEYTDNVVMGGGFAVKGTLFVGTNGVYGNVAGNIYMRNASGSNVIQFSGDGGVKSGGVKAYINSSGDGTFDGTLTTNILRVTNTGVIPNLNAEMVGGIKGEDIGIKQTAYDLGGDGVHSGLQVVQDGNGLQTQVAISSGIAYTKSGMRVVIPAGTSKSISAPSTTTNSNRYDAIYIAGPSEGNNEGLIRHVQGAYSATPIAPSIPTDGILLANVYMGSNQGTILNAQITDVRRWKAFRHEGSLTTYINTLSTDKITSYGGTVLIDKIVRNPSSNTSLTFSAGQTSKTFTHNGGLSNYVVRVSSNSPEPHIYWSNKTANAVTINLDDVCEGTVTVDVSIESY